MHDSKFFHFVDIPDLHLPAIGTQCKLRAFERPGDGSGRVRDPEVAEFGDLGVVSIPEVYAGGQTHSQVVLGAPVDEIEVVVVLEGRGVQYLAGEFVDLPSFCGPHRNLVSELQAGILVEQQVVRRATAFVVVAQDV